MAAGDNATAHQTWILQASRPGNWQSERWPERTALPTLGQMLLDQATLPGVTLTELECAIEESYTQRLY